MEQADGKPVPQLLNNPRFQRDSRQYQSNTANYNAFFFAHDLLLGDCVRVAPARRRGPSQDFAAEKVEPGPSRLITV
jgi:hypothetical protein